MGNIGELTDELLIKILLFLPTKVAVSTSILSKRWEFLWMLLPKLEYGSKDYSEAECMRLRCFLNRNLPLHRAPVIESLTLRFFNPHMKTEDVKLCVLVALSHCIRKLVIFHNSWLTEPDTLPSSLYNCTSLVTLKLYGRILVDVPRMVCLPCLKTLRLQMVTYFNEVSLQRLLSICPVLEDLIVRVDDNMRKLTVIVPSLRSLELCTTYLDEFVINTPSLNYLTLDNSAYCPKSHNCFIENMPELWEAYLDNAIPYIKNLIGSITNVKRLSFCPGKSSEHVYGDGIVFNELQHLKLCICQGYSLNLLVRLLIDSINLRVLELFIMDDHEPESFLGCNLPSTVPRCMLTSLETFKWRGYLGTPEEIDVAIYILGNACQLKIARISSLSCVHPTLDMLKELARCSRASTKCQLFFD